MDTEASPSSLAEAAGISISYASEILAGKRSPSQELAVSIWRKTGRKFGPLAVATDEEAQMMASLQERRGAPAQAEAA